MRLTQLRLQLGTTLYFVAVAQGHCETLALRTSTSLMDSHRATEPIVAEIQYADSVTEQRLGYLLGQRVFVSQGRLFEGSWDDRQSRFMSEDYADLHQSHVINRRAQGQHNDPTPGAWSLGLGVRASKLPQFNGLYSGHTVFQHKVVGAAQYQFRPSTAGTPSRLVLDSQLGYSQAYWQKFELSPVSSNFSQNNAGQSRILAGENERMTISQSRVGKLFFQPKDKSARSLIGIHRSVNLKPAENFLFFQGQLYSPSEISVLVNERLRYSSVVNPGQVDLYNVPLDPGVNDIRVLVRQLDGTLQQFSSSLNAQARLLPQGRQEFEYALGYNDVAGKPEVHGYLARAITTQTTARAYVSADSSQLAGIQLDQSVPWGLVSVKARGGASPTAKRLELTNQGKSYLVGAERTEQGWASWLNLRYSNVNVSLKKAFSDDFGLAQVSWTRQLLKQTISSLSCSYLRTSQGQNQRYCGVSLNFLMLHRVPAQVSISRSTGVQDGYTLQGSIQDGSAVWNALSSPSISNLSGQFPVGPVQARLSADSLGGRALGVDATFGARGTEFLGVGAKSSTENAILIAQLPKGASKVMFNNQLLAHSMAVDVPLDIQHRMGLDPESIPMDVDLESFTLFERPRFPGIYVMEFSEAVIEQ